MKSDFFVLEGEKIRCVLCPNKCLLDEGGFGACKVRMRKDGKIVNYYDGIISATNLDPIEKKPLYRFMPGSKIFSIGFFGCTLNCKFCQNHTISQINSEASANILKNKKYSPEEIVNYLIKNNLPSIAFTYSEPTLYFERVLEISKLCRKNGIKTVLVTNGYLNEEPAKILLEYIDAANIDLKSAKEEFYVKICSGRIEPVKKFIEIAFEKKVHIEITTLVIPQTNDKIEECVEITKFIANLSENIPFHISRYFPNYKFNISETPKETIYRWRDEAKKRLKFVYMGNMF